MSLYGIHVVICTEFLFTKYISHFIMRIICSYEAGTISTLYLIWILIKRCAEYMHIAWRTACLEPAALAHCACLQFHCACASKVSRCIDDIWGVRTSALCTCYHKQVILQMMTVTALRVRHCHSGFISLCWTLLGITQLTMSRSFNEIR